MKRSTKRVSKRVYKWVSNIVTVVLGFIMVATMYMAISSRVSGGTPTFFGLQMYEILSGSMEPGIHTGSVVFDKRNFDVMSLKPGDVITFGLPQNSGFAQVEGNAIVTHRIVQVVNDGGLPGFKTKGDANQKADPWTVPASNVIAQYDNFTIPYVGYYLNFLKSKLGIGLLLILPGALLLFTSIYGLVKELLRLQKAAQKETASETSGDSLQA